MKEYLAINIRLITIMLIKIETFENYSKTYPIKVVLPNTVQSTNSMSVFKFPSCSSLTFQWTTGRL